MRKIIYPTFIFILLFSVKAFSIQKEWIALKEKSPVKCKPLFTSLSGDQSQISFQLPGFYKEEIKTPGGSAFVISLPGAAKMLDAGMPDLPQLTLSLIIPDEANMKTEVIFSQYTDYNFSIAPSKGNLKRDIDPSKVPFTYSAAYSVNEFIPSTLTNLRQPYILRDFRGQAVVVNPFQYNPVTQTLRVYYSMTIKVSPSGNVSTKNVFNRQKPVTTIDATFAAIYQNHFMNFSPATYSPIFDHGKMLVISDASLMNAVMPFINWKNRMCQPTELVDVATIGTTSQDIKTYIENYYNAHGLTFVLLVGDGPQIPPFPSTNGDSDPSYGYIVGTDSYAEVFVGRFFCPVPVTVVVDDQHAPFGEQRIEVRQFVFGRLVPVRVQPEQSDLRWNDAWNCVFDFPLDEVHVALRKAGGEHVLHDLTPAGVALISRIAAARPEEFDGGRPVGHSVPLARLRHAGKRVVQVQVPVCRPCLDQGMRDRHRAAAAPDPALHEISLDVVGDEISCRGDEGGDSIDAGHRERRNRLANPPVRRREVRRKRRPAAAVRFSGWEGDDVVSEAAETLANEVLHHRVHARAAMTFRPSMGPPRSSRAMPALVPEAQSVAGRQP